MVFERSKFIDFIWLYLCHLSSWASLRPHIEKRELVWVSKDLLGPNPLEVVEYLNRGI